MDGGTDVTITIILEMPDQVEAEYTFPQPAAGEALLVGYPRELVSAAVADAVAFAVGSADGEATWEDAAWQ
jgi:hypothetical protein